MALVVRFDCRTIRVFLLLPVRGERVVPSLETGVLLVIKGLVEIVFLVIIIRLQALFVSVPLRSPVVIPGRLQGTLGTRMVLV